MLMQLGFRGALFASAVRFHSSLQGDVFLVSPRSTFLAQMQSFTRRRLYQALGFPGVRAAIPVYTSVGLWKNPYNGITRRIFVAAFEPSRPPLAFDGVLSHLEQLRQPDVVLFDAASRPDFGPIAERFRAGEAIRTEVENREVSVIGLFQLGTSFGIDGNLITSDLNFLRLFPSHDRGLIQIGVVQLEPGSDPQSVRDALDRVLPEDVEVHTKQSFVQREISYWASATPIGYVFTFGVIIGFVVGMVIVYQILFADVADHLAEYATLKAIGYRDGYLFAVVLFEAVALAVLGFLPGLGVSAQLYRVTNRATHLPMNLSLDLGVLVLCLTVLMCTISGVIAVRKVRSADPAEIF
jgi:putative ABC transport system permease protein